MISSSKLWKDCRGIAMVEFALISPMLFLLTIGIIDVGRMMWTASTLDHAVREGTRVAMIHPANQARIEGRVISSAVGVNAENLIVSINSSPDNNRGSVVTVAVEYEYSSLLVGFIGVKPITFRGTSSRTILSSLDASVPLPAPLPPTKNGK